MSFNVAVDGPAGAGKSTIAKKIAKELGFVYVDTGAMYRAMALYLLRKKVSGDNHNAIGERCQGADITLAYENGEQIVRLNGENVNDLIRTEEVGNMASVSSANPIVREKMVEIQKKLAESTDVIMDGRDIGTCVLPNAQLKIYLTASTRVRAMRRHKELEAKGISYKLEKIEADIKERDQRDMTREHSPLKQAEDAILVDSSDMTIDEVVSKICALVKEKKGN